MRITRPFLSVLFALGPAALGACEATSTRSASPGSSSVSVVVEPGSARVFPGDAQPFAATVSGTTDLRVRWTVAEGQCGEVSATGLYTAPPGTGTCHVVATSLADAGASGSATVSVVAPPPPGGEVLAFPGAEGFGARATGGRGGQVLKVTSLAASGPGTLQAALDVAGPRIVVFAVSGVIQGHVTVNHGDVTIAGQTAPGAGITIAGQLFGAYDASVRNIIVRHLRVRPPRCGTGCDAAQYDAIQFSRNSNLILDHISVAYGADETIDVYDASDVTIQWSTIEASQVANHPDGHIHNYGIIQGPAARRLSFHHNVCAHHSRRCPAIANGPAEVRNNVVYNVRHAFLHTNPAEGDFDLVGNTFKQGPNDSLLPFYFDDEDTSAATATRYYLRDNFVDDPGQLVGAVDDPWSLPSYFTDLYLDASHRSATEFLFSTPSGYVPVTTQAAVDAYDLVLASAGAFPRDGFTSATVDQVRNRTGGWDPDLPTDLLAGLSPTASPADGDGDGMPDAWETAHGLDPADGTDHRRVMPSGYTAIEEYINERAALVAP